MASDSVEIVNQLGGELVTYTQYGLSPIQFKAIVERRPTQVQNAGGFAYAANTVELLIPRDSTNGVTFIRERLDRVKFKKSLDDAQETEFSVNKVIQEDAGMLSFDGGMFRVLVQA